jgi:hypothetical protein
MSKYLLIVAALGWLALPTASGQQYSVQSMERPQTEDVSEEIAKRIADQGVRVTRGESRTVCEIWFCKDLAIDPDFKPTAERLYPFKPGQLIGLYHLRRRGSEFRDQQVSSGWYTLRFGLQPVDGNHVGTSPTRDFLLLVDAQKDEFPEDWKEKALHEVSAEAAGSAHPAMLCLRQPAEGAQMMMRHDEENDWWVLHVPVKVMVNKKPRVVPIDLVVVGHAQE